MNPPRSALYVPGSRPRMLARAGASEADALIVDLEDGVPPAEKVPARATVRTALALGEIGRSIPWMLRVNPAGSSWHDEDLAFAREARPSRVVLPKAESPAAVAAVAGALEPAGVGVALLIETALGVAGVRELAGCHARVEMLIVGCADLRLSLGARPDDARAWERHALGEILLAARVHGRVALDGVYFHFRDRAGLERHAQIARQLGFDGKSCIHPDQVAPIHAVWTSDASEIDWARKVHEAWRAQDGATRGLVSVDGEMIEALHLRLAERILARG